MGLELYGNRSERFRYLTTDAAPDAHGFYQITGITGTANGGAITGLQTAGTAIPGNGGYAVDNLVGTTEPQLTMHGFGFSVSNGEYHNPFHATDYLDYISRPPYADGAGVEPAIRFTATLVGADAFARGEACADDMHRPGHRLHGGHDARLCGAGYTQCRAGLWTASQPDRSGQRNSAFQWSKVSVDTTPLTAVSTTDKKKGRKNHRDPVHRWRHDSHSMPLHLRRDPGTQRRRAGSSQAFDNRRSNAPLAISADRIADGHYPLVTSVPARASCRMKPSIGSNSPCHGALAITRRVSA